MFFLHWFPIVFVEKDNQMPEELKEARSVFTITKEEITYLREMLEMIIESPEYYEYLSREDVKAIWGSMKGKVPSFTGVLLDFLRELEEAELEETIAKRSIQ